MTRIRTHTNPLSFHQRLERCDFHDVFHHFNGVLDVEIGFGRGVFIREWAKHHPDRCIVGVEVRKAMVDLLNTRLEEDSISTVHAIHGRGELVLEDMVEDGAIDRLFLFHPDPWFKRRHQRRRVLQTDFVSLMARKMALGGRFYVSTDVALLWPEIEQQMADSPFFTVCEDPEFKERYYKTHWQQFSDFDQRKQFFGVFQRVLSAL